MANKIFNDLNNRNDLQEHLFIRGFLVTNSKELFNTNGFPFYNNWNYKRVGSFQFLTHNKQHMYFFQDKIRTFFLVGHAYNPFTMEYEEEKILEKIALSFSEGESAYFDAINELTGLFLLGYVEKDDMYFLLDPSGFQSGYYGEIDGDFFITSHEQLLGDLYDLKIDPFAEELVNYKWYAKFLGPHLPADLSKYSNIKRIIPNIYYSYVENNLEIERFYPKFEKKTCESEKDYQEVIEAAANIMRNNMELITKKWDNPQISLSGGIDSNTTFAAANGIYDKYETFSYVSKENEISDAEAAEEIAERFNVKHTTYIIPKDSEELRDYDILSRIIDHNNGYIQYVKDYEKRKRIMLMNDCAADVEVKSWGSETIRAIYHKHFGRESFPKLSGKLYRNLYKVFLSNRSLARKVDKLYEDYIEKYSYEETQDIIPPTDLYNWEVVWGSWGSANISEMKICFEHTVQYNNRKLLDLLFRVPLESRLSDQHHLDMKRYLNEELYDMNIQVVSGGTNLKSKGANMIFSMNMILPF